MASEALGLLPGGFPRPFKALIFDLDGVLADTAYLHHAAWKRLATEIGLPFDETIGERLKGVDRLTSLEIVLGAAADRYSAEQKLELAERKNAYYRASIAQFGPQHLLPGAYKALVEARAAGLKIGLASASRSAHELVRRLGVAHFFDHIADAALSTRPKPDPEIFLGVAAALGIEPSDCLGVEDASAGVAAIKSANMAALGIGDPRVLAAADAVLPNLIVFDLKDFVSPQP
jgi:beta-phosphoglucomutase